MKNQSIKILASLIFGLCVSSSNAFAGGASAIPALPNAGTPMQATDAPGSNDGDCTPNYNTASKFFQEMLGEDATLGRISTFTTYYGKVKGVNTISNDGGTIFLNVQLSIGGVPWPASLYMPVKVCKVAGKLKAHLLISTAVFKSSVKDIPLKTAFKELPDVNVVNITRGENREILFKSETTPEQPASPATVK